MKRINRALVGSVVVLVVLLCASVYTQIVVKKDAGGFLEGRNYKEGTLWVTTFVRHKAGQDIPYLNALAVAWKKQMETLKRDGIIISYKVLQTNATRSADYNLMLLVEYKDMKTWETNADRQSLSMEAIARENPESWKVMNDDQVQEFFGSNLAKEIVFK